MKFFKKKDMILIFLILAIAVVGYFILKPNKKGLYYEVSSDSVVEVRASIFQNKRIELECGVVVVCDGKSAYFESSDCPDKTCVKSGKLSCDGEWAACLPNRVYLKVIGKE